MPKRDVKHDVKHDKWRNRVYKRFHYKCVMCGTVRSDTVQIEAHHIRRWIDHPELKYDINNGCCLCKNCHVSINNEEEKYIDQFDKIIEAKKQEELERKKKKRALENKIGKPSSRLWF